MIDALLALPSHLRKRLENALHAGLLAPPYQAAAVRAEVGNVAEVEGVVQALRELDASGVSGPGCAALLRCVDRAVSRRPTTDFVWSGPEVPGLHARDTPCQRDAFFDGPRAFEVLARRIAEGHPPVERTAQRRAIRPAPITWSAGSRTASWPGTVRPHVFYDPRSVNPNEAGVLHAKAVVATTRVTQPIRPLPA